MNNESIGPLSVFIGELVKVATNVEVDLGSDENGNVLFGKQAYIGVMLDYDDKYVLLGDLKDNNPIPNTAISHSQVVHVEFYEPTEESLETSSEHDTLN